jgi:hypothetical protein
MDPRPAEAHGVAEGDPIKQKIYSSNLNTSKLKINENSLADWAEEFIVFSGKIF